MPSDFASRGAKLRPPVFALRWRAAVLLAVLWFAFTPLARSEIQIASARAWPAQDYTRLTFEASAPIKFSLFVVQNPERVVLDMEGVELGDALKNFSNKILPSDPYIQQARVARNRPGIVRLVLDLKAEVKPDAFLLQPFGEYGYRLVLDIYPAQPIDPLMALVAAKSGTRETAAGAPPEPTPALKQASGLQAAAAPVAQEQKSPEKPAGTLEAPPAPGTGADAVAGKETVKIPQVDRLVTVAIDAGHGGEDPGARGKHGTYEKNVTLAIARRVKAMVDEVPNFRGVLIRDGDYFIKLSDRVEKARKVNADLFVSIHADAYVNSDAQGSSVFALSEHGATSAAARELAKRENEADQIGGVNLGKVQDPYLKQTLLDLTQTATINYSVKLGHAVLSQLGNVNALHHETVEQAAFAVLKSPTIPSILVETAFITNPEEEAKLSDEAQQQKIASAIAKGISGYFASNPPLARSKLARIE